MPATHFFKKWQVWALCLGVITLISVIIVNASGILYTNNIATGAQSCWELTNYSGTYDCNNVYDGSIAALGNCWIEADAGKGADWIALKLNRSYNIGTINMTNGDSGYESGRVIIQFSDDNATWRQVAFGQFPQAKPKSSLNFTNLTGYGNTTYIRFNITNSSAAYGAVGLCEVKIYEYQAPADAVNNPPTVTINVPTAGQVFTAMNNSFNVSGGDLENSTLTFYWFINGTFNKTTTSGNTTFHLNTANYVLNVAAWDGTNFSTNASRTFNINYTPPAPTNDTGILYGNNIATGSESCWSLTQNTPTYNCAKIYDNSIAALTNCWLESDTGKGNDWVALKLNRSYNIGTINITNGDSGYEISQVIIQFSEDNVSWSQVATGQFPQATPKSSLNFTSLTGYGNTTYIRFNATNSSAAYNAVGICEVKIYEYQAPIMPITLTSSINPSTNISVAQNSLFTINTTITCGPTACGTLNASLDPSDTQEQSITRTANTETVCDGNICTLTSQPDTTNYYNGSDYIPIVTDIQSSSKPGFDYEVTTAPYALFFRNNSNTAGAVTFEKNGYSFSYDVSGGQMLWAVRDGQPAATDTLGGGNPSNSQNTQIRINGNEAEYAGTFYNTNITYKVLNDMLKEEYVLYGLPTYKDYYYLQYGGNIKFNKTLQICTDRQCFTPSGTQDDFETQGKIYFKDPQNNTVFFLKEPLITDAAGNKTLGTYKVRGSNAQMSFYLRINKTWLQNVTYPVTIDPTVAFGNETGCGGYLSASTAYNIAREAADAGTLYIGTYGATAPIRNGIVTTTYYVGRVYCTFSTSPLPDNANILSAYISINVSTFGTSHFGDRTFTVVNGTANDPYNQQTSDFPSVGGGINGARELSSRIAPPGDSSSDQTIVFDLNSYGLAVINKTGLSQFGFRSGQDIDGVTPTDGVNETSIYKAFSRDSPSSGLNLTVIYEQVFNADKPMVVPQYVGSPFFVIPPANNSNISTGVLANAVYSLNWTVNATGNVSSSYTFYVNVTDANNVQLNISQSINVTITAPTAPPSTTCDCPISGGWNINDGSDCTLTTQCTTTTVWVNNGKLRIASTGTLIATGGIKVRAGTFYTQTGAKIKYG